MRQATQTLRRLRSPLAHTRYQLKVLHQPVETHSLPSFADTLRQHGKYPLKRAKLEILQLNLGKLCNQTCRHCHVDAGPDRKDEVMSKDILQRALELIRMHRIPTVDLTNIETCRNSSHDTACTSYPACPTTAKIAPMPNAAKASSKPPSKPCACSTT